MSSELNDFKIIREGLDALCEQLPEGAILNPAVRIMSALTRLENVIAPKTAQHPAVEALKSREVGTKKFPCIGWDQQPQNVGQFAQQISDYADNWTSCELQDRILQFVALTSQTPAETSEKPYTPDIKDHSFKSGPYGTCGICAYEEKDHHKRSEKP